MDLVIIVMFILAGGIPALKKMMGVFVSVLDDAAVVTKTVSSQIRREVLAQAQAQSQSQSQSQSQQEETK